jgi:hypothetical protein
MSGRSVDIYDLNDKATPASVALLRKGIAILLFVSVGPNSTQN